MDMYAQTPQASSASNSFLREYAAHREHRSRNAKDVQKRVKTINRPQRIGAGTKYGWRINELCQCESNSGRDECTRA